MSQPGCVTGYCCVCDEAVSLPVDDVRAALVSLVFTGRYGDLNRYVIHECPDGRLGTAELVEGVPMPMEGEPESAKEAN